MRSLGRAAADGGDQPPRVSSDRAGAWAAASARAPTFRAGARSGLADRRRRLLRRRSRRRRWAAGCAPMVSSLLRCIETASSVPVRRAASPRRPSGPSPSSQRGLLRSLLRPRQQGVRSDRGGPLDPGRSGRAGPGEASPEPRSPRSHRHGQRSGVHEPGARPSKPSPPSRATRSAIAEYAPGFGLPLEPGKGP